MPLESTNLDDRTYKDIIEEAKNLIPRYAPEWTDWNDHDPGITLIQLFSHLIEIIVYRLNQVPDKNYIEFLRLIGIELKPATPAKAHLTFTLSDPLSDETKGYITIPKGTSVETEPPGEEEPIIFETDLSLIAVGTTLKGVQTYDGYSFSSVQDGQSYYPFSKNIQKGSAFYLGFSRSFPDVEIGMRVELDTSDLPVEGAHCDLENSLIFPPAEVVWEYWNNGWKELDIVKDETKAFLRSGYIYFMGPKDIKQSKQGLLTEKEDDELYWIRCRVKETEYEFPPKIEKILLNTVLASNGVTVKDEIIGSSDGTSNQDFSLENAPVLAGSLVLDVDEGEGWKIWDLANDFYASTKHDKHFLLNRVKGEIKFGDGLNGKIPFAGVNNIKVSYRYGGGSKGNVGSGSITSLQNSVSDVEEVTNHMSAFEGSDEETVQSAKERGPRELKTRQRAVASEDFELLARETPGIRVVRAKALPLYHPEFAADIKIPGVVTVIVVPYSEEKKPVPSKGMIRTVCEHLNKHRLLTTELFVIPPKYKEIKIETDIVAENWSDVGEVKKKVKESLEKYFHPLQGGTKRDGWPFGGSIYLSGIYRVILGIDGVSRIVRVDICVDDEKQDSRKNVEIPDHYLVYSGDHDISVRYDREEA